MKILYIINDPSIFIVGTESRSELERCAALVDEFHVLSQGHETKEIQEGTLFLHPVPPSKKLHIGMMTARAHRLITEYSIDVVSAQDPFECGAVAHGAVQKTNAKLHIQLATNIFSPWFTRGDFVSSFVLHSRLKNAQTLLSKASGIRTFSKQIQESLLPHIDQNKTLVSVIPDSAMHTIPIKGTLPEHSFAFTFVTIAPLEKEERIEDVLEALMIVGQSYPQTGLMIIGEGSKEAVLKEKAIKLGLKDRVLFLGTRNDQWSIVQDAHAYLYVGAYEKKGQSLMQVAMCHIPIITTEADWCVGEVLTPSIDVLTVPIGDIRSLVVQMRMLIEDQRLRHVLALGARAKVEHFLSTTETDHAKKVVADLEATLHTS